MLSSCSSTAVVPPHVLGRPLRLHATGHVLRALAVGALIALVSIPPEGHAPEFVDALSYAVLAVAVYAYGVSLQHEARNVARESLVAARQARAVAGTIAYTPEVTPLTQEITARLMEVTDNPASHVDATRAMRLTIAAHQGSEPELARRLTGALDRADVTDR